ncbi:hypothetical protein BKA70DRAFT_1387744 [Coprinopsis sp. MPI-PUGE-AT-0042]|nr:hypothetical protein BKA70DRAFT_1387744 [Coprinopsis sp. MPI-PUGE-AT-0042]
MGDDKPGLDQETLKSRQDYLDFNALSRSGTEPTVGPDATPEEKAADRHRRLSALTTKHRCVFSTWPRDPNGKPNGIEAWGNSLFDFYSVQRMPDVPSLVTFTTGSKLLTWMKKNGEMYAEDQMAMAESEPEPEEIRPWPIAESFKDTDRRVSMKGGAKGKRKEGIEFGVNKPFAPFNPAPLLQERVTFRLLPKRLVDWDAKPDIVSVYRLKFSDEGRKKLQEEEDEIAKRQKEDNKAFSRFLENPTTETMILGRGVLVYLPEHEKSGPATPALFFTHEPAPIKQPVDEAHVYLSPDHLIGTGNHSYAFQVDWEVPRSMIVDDLLCEVCVIEKGFEIIKEEDGPKGERKNPQWKERSGKVVNIHDFSPGVSVSAVDAHGKDVLDEDGNTVGYDILPSRSKEKNEYRGPLRVVHTGVEYQNPERGPLCVHLAPREQPASLTGNVCVVAKLSHPGDEHLEHEAEIYQSFPRHFFQHFTGYNQLRPLHDPFPIGALVPQFFGYYVPETGIKPMVFDRDVSGSGVPGEEGRKKWKETNEKYGYRSPIMLLEHCGRAIPEDVTKLSIDERETCASLFLRMHHGGWMQGSPFTRNILMQSGPISTYPLERMVNAYKARHDLRQTSFRLIDFGRSKRLDKEGTSRNEEETRIMKLMKLLHYDV